MSGTRNPESNDRRRTMLRTALGHRIAAALADPVVIEIMVNPDGCLRLDRLGEGIVDTGHRLDPAAIERIIRLVASTVRVEAHEHNPIVSAELPPHGEGLAGERFEGLLPPVSRAPCFSIRKPAARVFTLEDYVSEHSATLGQLLAASDGAVGSLQAQQATNQLVALTAKQQLQIQNLMAAQYRAEALDEARKVEAEQAARTATDRFLGPGHAYTPQ